MNKLKTILTASLTPIIAVTVASLTFSQASLALSTDRDQEAEIVADDVEINMKTGKRVFIGNVKILQGSLKIKADKLIVNYKNGRMQDATAYGNPAKFRQRPDGQASDDEGEGQEIYINGPANSIDLKKNAKLRNAQQRAKGNHIYYNRASGKLSIKGLKNKKRNSEIDNDDFFNPTSSKPAQRTQNTPSPVVTKEPSNIADLPIYDPTRGAETVQPVTNTPPTTYDDDRAIDRGETLPEKLVLPKKSSSSGRSRLIIIPK